MPDVHPERPRVLYAATLAPWMRLFTFAVAGLLTLFLGSAVLSGIFAGRGPSWILVAIVVPVLVMVIAMVVLANRLSFTVTTIGIDIRGYFHTYRIPWSDVAVIEVDRSYWHQGQTVVVTRSGQRIGSVITETRTAMRRGESRFDHGPDLMQPAKPTRAAIDAHQRYLRGDFRSVSSVERGDLP